MKILVSRYGAFGDVIHCSHLPRLIKEHYNPDVLDFETNHKGYQILLENPYIDNLRHIDPEQLKLKMGHVKQHWKAMEEEYDLFFNLFDSLEHRHIAMEDQPEYYMSTKKRRKLYGNINFYDAMTAQCNLPESYFGTGGELYFSKEERNIVEKWLRSMVGDSPFVIMNLGGTSLQKKFTCSSEVARMIRLEFPEMKIMITGDKYNHKYAPDTFDIDLVERKFPFRQSLLIAEYADLVISTESGFAVGAGALGTPCVQMLTTSSLANHCKNNKNDFSIESEAFCSPCHKGTYRFIGCPSKDGLPICTHFNPERVMEQVRRAYVRSSAVIGLS